ncbi:DUF6807 family protein [Rhodopirellula sp. JC639]|uniref:DUF6807 family protein n=1 Tax=Stieleria mannarensis TaxID=2755585 RepID=UPI0016029964|nr:DUF6807 family protein [Rhodopirellula sp. JC639]
MSHSAFWRLLSLAAVVASTLIVTTPALSQVDLEQTEAAPPFRCVQTDDHLTVYCGRAEVLRYNIAAPKAPAGINPKYQRSGYIHPIYSPAGRLVSGDFAADHPHQHGLFAAWTDTSFQGRKVDFWNQLKGIGIVLHDRVIAVDPPGQRTGFSVAVKHYAIDDQGIREAILDDVWTVSVTGVPGDGGAVGDPGVSRYLIGFSSEQTNLTEHPLTINEYHYGGVGFRGNNAWYSDESAKALSAYVKQTPSEAPPLEQTRHRFLTSEGHDRRLGNHSRPEWMALYGIVDQSPGQTQTAGVKVSGSPLNEQHPVPVRLHPSKPYFSLSPCVVGSFDIDPGQTYRMKYDIEVFDGAP